MNQPSLNDLLRLFLETRVPILFLIGSLALAILGNAVYELLVNAFGATPQFLIALIISAVMIFSFVVLGFQRLLRAIQRRGRTNGEIKPDEQALPHAGLILPVSPNPKAADAEIIAWHVRQATLRHCWLLATREVAENGRLGDLQQLLLDRNVTPHVLSLEDAIRADEVYAKVREAIEQARPVRDAWPLIADITGGTKAMTAGILLACLDANVPVQYWVAPRDRHGHPLPSDKSGAMKVVIPPLSQGV
ncbi:MAG: hypothetical protein SNJ69_15680 [Chloroflexaceae bacterium]